MHTKSSPLQLTLSLAVIPIILFLTGCTQEPPVENRYSKSDVLFEKVRENAESSGLEIITSIDHSRLAAEDDAGMPPARVLIFSDSSLDAEILKINPLAGIDLPFRVLAFEPEGGGGKVIYNHWAYLSSRYDLPADGELEKRYRALIGEALADIDPSQIATFEQNEMKPDGIITHQSDYDFETTLENVHKAITNAEGTAVFGEMDFQARSREVGVELPRARLILWGAPVPGAKAMASGPTLGLDAFCQKFLIWEGEDGKVRLSYNDLLALADRQGVRSPPLQVITRQIEHTFEPAVSAAAE